MRQRVDWVRHLVGRALVTAPILYALVLGGTFNGLLLPQLREFSLLLLSIATLGVGALAWRAWRTPVRVPAVFVLAWWAVAYVIAALAHPTARTAIGVWWAGLYLALWLALILLRAYHVPGQWLTDALLIAVLPLMALAVMQVAGWYLKWMTVRSSGIALIPPRPSATLGNANALGGVLAIVLPLGMGRALSAARILDRRMAALWSAGAGAVLFLTFSRGAWLAAGIGGAGMALAWYAQRRQGRAGRYPGPLARRRDWRVRRTILAGSMALMVLGGAALMMVAAQALATPRRETGTRLDLMRAGWQAFAAQPLTGHGPYSFGRYWSRERSIPPAQPHAHAHNLVANVAAELGVPGLIAVGVTAGVMGQQAVSRRRRAVDDQQWWHQVACTAGVAAAAMHSLVDLPLLEPALMVLVLLVLAAGLPDGLSEAQSRSGWRWAGPFLVGLWLVVLSGGWWSARLYVRYFEGQRWLAEGALAQGTRALDQVRQAWPQMPLYAAEYGYACGLLAAQGDDRCLEDGIAAYEHALAREPEQAIWWANLAALYWQAGKPVQAMGALRFATRYAPDAADLWLNLGLYAEALGHAQQALSAYRAVLEADEDWHSAAFWQTSVLRQQARSAYGGPAITPLERALALWRAGDDGGAQAYLKSRTQRDPAQPEPYVQWARYLIVTGKLDQAREVLAGARLLVHTANGRAWVAVAEAELAEARGDRAASELEWQRAYAALWPDKTGHSFLYARDVALLQFLHIRVGGALLPQLAVYGSEPGLVELLKSHLPPDAPWVPDALQGLGAPGDR